MSPSETASALGRLLLTVVKTRRTEMRLGLGLMLRPGERP
jgi:hypothetical protein